MHALQGRRHKLINNLVSRHSSLQFDQAEPLLMVINADSEVRFQVVGSRVMAEPVWIHDQTKQKIRP